jgi:hypothetical protein
MKSIRQIREASGGKEAYQKFFNSILKKFGVDSPSELKGDKKKEFFDTIDKGWDGDNEKAESVSEAKKLSGGKGKAEIDINFMGDKKDAKFAATKYKIGIKVTSNGAILSGDKQKILAYLQGQDYAMDAEDIEDLYPELMETYDDPDDYESEKDVTLNPDENPLATGKSLGEAFTKSYGYTHTEEAINHLMKSLQPKSMLARTISANADNVTREFTKMSKLMGKIMEQWEAVEMVIGMNESVDEAANSSLLKKAQAIASKLSGNMTKAVAEIEKLKKGLSDDKKVMAMLKTANEAVNELKVDQEVTANIKGKKVRVRIIAIDSDKNPNLAMHVVDLKDPDKDYFVKRKDVKEATIPQGKTAMTKKDSVTKKDRNTLSKIGKMLDKEKKSRKEAMAMCEQCGKMHEEGACGESVEEAKMSGKEKKHYASLMRIALAGRKANPDFTSSIASNGDFVVSDRGNVVARLKKGTFKHFESVEEARLDKADYDATTEKGFGGYRPKVVNNKTNKDMYLSSRVFKDEKSAKGHAQAYLDGYVAAGERRASKATAAYDKSNASKIKESVDENLRKDIAKMSSKFPEGSKVKMKHDGKIAKVLSVSKDSIKVAVGNKTMEHKPTDLVPVDEAIKISHVLIDTAKGNKVVSMASSEEQVKQSKHSAERPPMSVKDKNTLKVVALKKPLSRNAADKLMGQSLKESAELELDEAAKVLSKKGDYAFSTYKNSEVDVTYKGKIIATGDFDSGADAWFLDIKGTKGQRSFDSAADVIKFFMKNKITEAVSVDRRTTGFKEALKRRAEAKAKREAMKIKAAKIQAKTDMANIDANYAYDGSVEEILASANKKIMGEDAPANASSSGAVDMNPTGKSKKKDKESLVTRSASLMAKRGY